MIQKIFFINLCFFLLILSLQTDENRSFLKLKYYKINIFIHFFKIYFYLYKILIFNLFGLFLGFLNSVISKVIDCFSVIGLCNFILVTFLTEELIYEVKI